MKYKKDITTTSKIYERDIHRTPELYLVRMSQVQRCPSDSPMQTSGV